jgi:hypothetical protein
MEKYVGTVKSENTGTIYSIWWNPSEKTVWIDAMFGWKEQVGHNILNELSAIMIAKVFINQQK